MDHWKPNHHDELRLQFSRINGATSCENYQFTLQHPFNYERNFPLANNFGSIQKVKLQTYSSEYDQISNKHLIIRFKNEIINCRLMFNQLHFVRQWRLVSTARECVHWAPSERCGALHIIQEYKISNSTVLKQSIPWNLRESNQNVPGAVKLFRFHWFEIVRKPSVTYCSRNTQIWSIWPATVFICLRFIISVKITLQTPTKKMHFLRSMEDLTIQNDLY